MLLNIRGIFSINKMAFSVDYIYSFSRTLIRKNMAGGLKSTDFESMWNDAQNAYMEDLLGRFQLRSNGKTGMNTGLIEDETILQKLSPFIQNISLTITTGGLANKPQNFLYRLGIRINGYDVYKINYNQIDSVNHSVIDPPSVTANRYYFVEYDGRYSFLPTTLPTVSITTSELDFVSQPANIVWAFIFDSNGRQIYDAANSVQPLWNNDVCMEITKRALKSFGVSFKDSDFSNFGQSVITAGD